MAVERKNIASGAGSRVAGLAPALGGAGRVVLEELSVPADRLGAVYRHEAGHTPPMPAAHRHQEWELNLVTEGRAEYVVDGRRVTFGRDALMWLLPGQAHYLLGRWSELVMWVVVFKPALIRRLSRDPAMQPWRIWLRTGRSDDALPRVLGERAAGAINGLCSRLYASDDLGPAAAAHAFGWLAASAWSAYQQADDVPSGTHLHPGVEAAARWMAEHAYRPAADDLDALARRVKLSRSHLSRLFIAQTGRSLTAYRQTHRVRRFLALVGRGGRCSMTEAAYAAGFGSYTQCYRAVRQETGETPREWCRNRRNAG